MTLRCLPPKSHKDSQALQSAIDKQLKFFSTLEGRLHEVALDSVMCLAKLASCLVYYHRSEKAKVNQTTVQADKTNQTNQTNKHT